MIWYRSLGVSLFRRWSWLYTAGAYVPPEPPTGDLGLINATDQMLINASDKALL